MRGGRDRLRADLRGERPVQAASREPILVRVAGQPTARLVDGTQPGSPSLEREVAGQRPELTHLRKEQHRRRERCASADPVSVRARAVVSGSWDPLQQQDSAPRQPLHRQECPSDAPGYPRRLTMTSWPKLFLRPTQRGKAPSPRRAADGYRSVNESNRTGDTRMSSLGAGSRAELGFGQSAILGRRRMRCQ